ncbi:MAG: sigma-70 family RNA polymerase sigma factor [Polyangiaceae bacterium]
MESTQPIDFLHVYDDYADFVWRTVRRLGVDPTSAEDVFQEVFVVVHRRLDDFEGRSSVRTWLFGITLRIVRNHKRALGRKRHEGGEQAEIAIDRAPASGRDQPEARTQRAQAVRLLHEVLDTLDDDKREVFVMAELEQMSGAAIAEVTGLNQSTVYARLRGARQQFDQAVKRLSAKRDWARHRPAPRERRTR